MALNLLTDLPDASITAYYRASNVTLNGSDVSQLDDLTGGGEHFVQATAGNQPVYNATNANFDNKPTIDPVSASSEFMRASTLDLGTTFTVIVIGAANGVSQAIFSEDNTADDGYVGFDGFDKPIIDNGATRLTSLNAADTNPAIFEYRVNGTTSLIRDKAVEGNAGTLGTANTWSDIYLFRRQDGTLGFDGVVADILIVSGSLTQADRKIIYQYANQRYGMAIPFPQPSAGISTTASGSTTHNVNMESDIEEGDLLRVVASINDDELVTPAGWTLFGYERIIGVNVSVLAKVADGTEGGGTVNFATGTNAAGCFAMHRVRDWYGALGGFEISSSSESTSSSPNPASQTTSWGAINALWAPVCGHDNPVTGGISGYTNFTAFGTTNKYAGACFKEVAAATEDPGAFSASPPGDWVAFNNAIRPIETVPLGGGAGIMAGVL